MRTEFLCTSVLRVASGPRVKLASFKSALNPSLLRLPPSPPHPAVVHSTDRSKAVVPMLFLLFVTLWFILLFYEAISFMSYLVLFCSRVFCFVFFLLFFFFLFCFFFFCFFVCFFFVLFFSVLLALRLPRLGKKELILVLFIRLLDLRLFGFLCFPLPFGV